MADLVFLFLRFGAIIGEQQAVHGNRSLLKQGLSPRLACCVLVSVMRTLESQGLQPLTRVQRAFCHSHPEV